MYTTVCCNAGAAVLQADGVRAVRHAHGGARVHAAGVFACATPRPGGPAGRSGRGAPEERGADGALAESGREAGQKSAVAEAVESDAREGREGRAGGGVGADACRHHYNRQAAARAAAAGRRD